MINEQIHLWIVQNRPIYFKQGQNDNPINESISDVQLLGMLERMNCELKKALPIMLKKRRKVSLKNFITFFLLEDLKSQQIRPHYRFLSPFKFIIPHQHHHQQPQTEEEQYESVELSLTSSMMIDRDKVTTLLAAYCKSIYDLVNNNHEILINFDFCQLKISKKVYKCNFRKVFLREINEKQQQIQKQNYRLYICPPFKCQTKTKMNLTNQTQRIRQQKWQQIRLGNLYAHPSLQQIKNLYDRGRQLEIKYKEYFNN